MSEDNLRRTLGDTGWVITELESVIVPIADGESAVMWSLQARRSVSL